MKRKMKLNKTAIRELEATKKEYTCYDTKIPGYGIRVFPSGRKSYILWYRDQRGRTRKLTLGTFPELSPALARKKAREFLGNIMTGGDPGMDKSSKRDYKTFGDLAEKYIERHASKKKTGYEDERILRKSFIPQWGNTPVEEITRADVYEILETIADRAPVMANRSLACVRKCFNFGIQRGFLEHNPCHLIQPLGKETKRDRVLSDDEIRALWPALDEIDA